jgi:hypothetical protein
VAVRFAVVGALAVTQAMGSTASIAGPAVVDGAQREPRRYGKPYPDPPRDRYPKRESLRGAPNWWTTIYRTRRSDLFKRRTED